MEEEEGGWGQRSTKSASSASRGKRRSMERKSRVLKRSGRRRRETEATRLQREKRRVPMRRLRVMQKGGDDLDIDLSLSSGDQFLQLWVH